ncbi:MAG: ribonuclease P protein component [Holosporaceae bacterium]
MQKVYVTSLTRKSAFQRIKKKGRIWRCDVFKACFLSEKMTGWDASVEAPMPLKKQCVLPSTKIQTPPTHNKQTTNDSVLIYQGLILSKRFSKKAVVRNKARRILKEALRAALLQTDSVTCSAQIVIIPNLLLLQSPFQKVVTGFLKVLPMITGKKVRL